MPLLVPTTALAGTVLYRVNAGGPTLAATPGWSEDTAATPSPYVNWLQTGNYLYGTTAAIDLTHPSVPAGTPASLFQAERYDVPGGAQMKWKFQVSAGGYEVRLHFADIYSGTQSVGARGFDVFIEGALALDDYDIFADAGGYRGVVRSLVVTSDSSLDIRFAHVVEVFAVDDPLPALPLDLQGQLRRGAGRTVRFYTIVSFETLGTVETLSTREAAEAMIGDVRADDPELAELLRVDAIELETSPN